MTNHDWSSVGSAERCRKCSLERKRQRRFPNGGLRWIYFLDGRLVGTVRPACYPTMDFDSLELNELDVGELPDEGTEGLQ